MKILQLQERKKKENNEQKKKIEQNLVILFRFKQIIVAS